MAEVNIGFHPYVRQSRVAIISRLPRKKRLWLPSKKMTRQEEMDLTGLPHSVKNACHYVFEAPFEFYDASNFE